jgi:type IV secretory pathway TrbL component
MKFFKKIKEHINELSKRNFFVLSVGIATYGLAIKEYFSPTIAHSKRWAWLFNWATEMFGVNGSMYIYIVIGTLSIVYALIDNKDYY